MSDKRLYPNTVIFKGTDDNEITYINERVLEQIRAKIEKEADYQDAYVNADVAKGLYMALEIIDKYKAEEGN